MFALLCIVGFVAFWVFALLIWVFVVYGLDSGFCWVGFIWFLGFDVKCLLWVLWIDG